MDSGQSEPITGTSEYALAHLVVLWCKGRAAQTWAGAGSNPARTMNTDTVGVDPLQPRRHLCKCGYECQVWATPSKEVFHGLVAPVQVHIILECERMYLSAVGHTITDAPCRPVWWPLGLTSPGR